VDFILNPYKFLSGDNFLHIINQHPKNTHWDKGFSLWHSLSSMFAHIDLELPQTHSQGLPIVISKAYCCNIYLRNHRYFLFLVTPGQFCSSQGSPIQQILQLSLESSSFCLGINHIGNTLFGLWYSGSREFPNIVRRCFVGISGPLSGLFFLWTYFFSPRLNYSKSPHLIFKWPFDISNVLFFTANYIAFLPIAYNCC